VEYTSFLKIDGFGAIQETAVAEQHRAKDRCFVWRAREQTCKTFTKEVPEARERSTRGKIGRCYLANEVMQ
jgi:hypothetical protein